MSAVPIVRKQNVKEKDTMLEIFFELHEDLAQQGPGSDEYTRKAFSLTQPLSPKSRILDLGCGPGRQTIELAKLSKGEIHAVDNHKPYIEELRIRTMKARVTEKIKTHVGSMDDLNFAEESFDLIWSEGAIYSIGFEKGLKLWRRFLKPGCYIAVTEVSWLKSDLPEELRNYWNVAYPDIGSIGDNIRRVEQAEFELAATLTLPASTWWDGYYTQILERMEVLNKKYADDETARKVFDEEKREIEMFRRYSDYYSYVFYIAKRPL